MKRKLAAVLLVFVLGIIALLVLQIYRGAAAKRATAEQIAVLPPFELQRLDGTQLRHTDLDPDLPVVLAYFDTECPYCKTEIRSILDHSALRETAQVLLVSDQEADVLEAFVLAYGLNEEPAMQVLRDSEGALGATFGITRVPATFLYGRDRRLQRRFQGEVSADVLYRVLVAPAAAAPAKGAVPAEADCGLAQPSSDCNVAS